MSSATKDLLQEHLIVRRIGNIAQTCSDRLYANEDIPIEDIQIISVVIEEFVDVFHHGKEEKAYFPATKEKDGYTKEEIRKFLIEHELGRRIAIMLRRELDALVDKKKEKEKEENNDTGSGKGLKWNGKNKEPVARFLKSYAVFVSDHTGKEDAFFETMLENSKILEKEDQQLLKHYEICKLDAGGDARIEEMMRLIGYLEDREWM